MIRVVCITIIISIIYHKDIKLKYMCKAEESKSVDLIKILKSIKKYIGAGANYLSNRFFKQESRQSFRDKFIKNVERGLKVVRPSKERQDMPKRKQLDNVAKPVHKYNQFKTGQSAIQLIKAHGYKGETHRISTYDGYILTVHRIMTSARTPSKETVIIHHGLLGSADDWLLLGPGRALPYLLSDQGYDVWLLNARGNKYSRGHHSKDTDSFEFWDFSFHEMGIYDLPAALTYISDFTDEANLYYIGHSMGGTALLVLLSTFPDYNRKIKLAILLAPLAFMAHANGPLKIFGNYREQKHFHIEQWQKEFVENNSFSQFVFDQYCKGSRETCSNPLLLLTNGGKDITDVELRHKVLSHVPAGGSVKTLAHYTQLIKSSHFQDFDNGVLNNLKYYKNKKPPRYNLSNITLPIVLFASSSDWLSTIPDISLLSTKLGSVKSVDSLDNYDHFDFVWSKDAAYMLYYIMIDILDETASRHKRNNLITTML